VFRRRGLADDDQLAEVDVVVVGERMEVAAKDRCLFECPPSPAIVATSVVSAPWSPGQFA
jgi:hypothetical protein